MQDILLCRSKEYGNGARFRTLRSTTVENSLQIGLFMQNKANVKIGKYSVSMEAIKDYNNKQRTINNERHSKQSQFKPNPSALLTCGGARTCFKRGGHAALLSADKKHCIFKLNLLKWTLGSIRQKPMPTASIENRVSSIEFLLCVG